MAENYGVSSLGTQAADDLIAGDAKRVEEAVTLKACSTALGHGTLLGRRDSDGKYASIDPGTAYTDEDRGDGDGSTKTFSGTLTHPGLKPGTLVIAAVVVGDGTETFTDNGDGTLTSDGATPGAGTIVYATGAYSVTFFVAPKSGEDVLASYVGALDKVNAEAIGTGDGTEVEWSGFLASTKVVPGSLRFVTNDTTPKVLRDDGNGNLVGDDGEGSINYDTGEYYLEFDAAPANTKTITADYCTYDGTQTARAVLSRDFTATETAADVKVRVYLTGEFDKTTVFANHTGLSAAQQQEIINDCRERGIFIKPRIVGA